MAPTLPRELVSQVIRELFMDADEDQLDDVAAFQRLRLVAHHIKADAHQAWLGGLALLANGAAFTAEKLLLPRVTDTAFEQGLEHRHNVLEETKSLRLNLNRWESTGELKGVAHDQAWFYLARQILRRTRALQSLCLLGSGARLALNELPLAHLHLRELLLHGTARGLLVGLDLSKMDTLELLEATTEDGEEGAADLLGFRLPPNASIIKLQWMSLSSDQVDALGLPSIAALRHLDLTGSRLTHPLPDMPALRELSLHGARIDNHFFRCLASWSMLERLDISSMPVTDVTALALATHTSLKRLDASNTGIRHPAVFGLSTNTALQELKVRGCSLTSLAFGLSSNRTLKELSLSRCRFTVPLMQQLVAELAGNGTLASLELSYCSLKDDAMAHFKLEKTTGLEKVDLSVNDLLTDTGLQPLANSIAEHGLLRKLDLSYCDKVTDAFLARVRTPARTVLARRWWE